MQIPSENEIKPDHETPEEEEIHGLEETQANIVRNEFEGSGTDLPATDIPVHEEEPLAPDAFPALGDTIQVVRPVADSNAVSTSQEGQDSDAAAQTVRVTASQPVEADLSTSPAVLETAVTSASSSDRKARRRPKWILFTVVGLLILATIALLAGLGGYLSGISLRENAAITQVAQVAKEQYELGVDDYVQGNYYRARQRFEYVIQIDPSYPGAVDMLANVLLELNTTATPTLLPTATVMPTADLRGVEELYNQGDQFLFNGQWTQAIDAFLQLRKTNPEYRTVEIDGKLFLALRHRGRDKILLESDLEGGIYDLTLAQRFGIMDVEGQSLLNWSTYYITGASFWDLDWAQAAYYFGQVAPHAPNLVDKSGITARERYRVALVHFASQLMNQKQFCKAQEQLGIALSILQDPEIQAGYDQAAQLCSGVPAPGEEPTQAP